MALVYGTSAPLERLHALVVETLRLPHEAEVSTLETGCDCGPDCDERSTLIFVTGAGPGRLRLVVPRALTAIAADDIRAAMADAAQARGASAAE